MTLASNTAESGRADTLRAAAWMFGTVLSFTLMAVAGRELAHTMTTFEILFFRSLFGVIVLTFLIGTRAGMSFTTQRVKGHLLRNLAHFTGQFSWIYAIAYISLAEVFAIEATAPIWTAVIAVFLLGEKLTPQKLVSIILGFIGMLLILRPGISIVHPAAVVVLLGSVGYGLAYVMTKSLAASEAPSTILFYMCTMQLPLAFAGSVFDWITPSGIQWLWLGLIGGTALTGHYCIARAMQLADATVVVPMDFLRLPVIALVGFLMYNEAVDWLLLVGALLIFGGTFVNIRSPRSQNAGNEDQ